MASLKGACEGDMGQASKALQYVAKGERKRKKAHGKAHAIAIAALSEERERNVRDKGETLARQ